MKRIRIRNTVFFFVMMEMLTNKSLLNNKRRITSTIKAKLNIYY